MTDPQIPDPPADLPEPSVELDPNSIGVEDPAERNSKSIPELDHRGQWSIVPEEPRSDEEDTDA